MGTVIFDEFVDFMSSIDQEGITYLLQGGDNGSIVISQMVGKKKVLSLPIEDYKEFMPRYLKLKSQLKGL